jgi:diketogulonate reductase-like aldo/keto reductase
MSMRKPQHPNLGTQTDVLLQYEDKDYLEILAELVNITKTHPELVSAIGLCNFDSKHTDEVCEYLLAKQGAVGIVSNQVQVRLTYSSIYYIQAHQVSSHYSTLGPCSR